MNKKALFSIVLLGFLVTSIFATDLSKGIVVTDQLDLKVGSTVKGKYFFTNATLTDELIGSIFIDVEDAWATSDTAESVFQVKLTYEMSAFGEDFLEFDELTTLEMTHLIFKTNRTDFMPAARLYMGNSSFSFTASMLHKDSISELIDIDNLMITLHNGSVYTWGDYNSSMPEYGDLVEYAFSWALFNGLIAPKWLYTFLAISPTANIGDTINYLPVQGDVVAKPAVSTPAGSYDAIQVEYLTTTWAFGFKDTTELTCFYEAGNGLLLKTIEEYVFGTLEFVPEEIDLSSGIPFAIEGAVLGLVAMSVALIIYRRKKR